MSNVKIMSAKLHRFTVTEAKRDYVGSITIDEDLLDKVGILPLEEVEIVNINNGERWSTYALPGKRGNGDICPNGGGALLCKPGDILIIFSYAYLDREEVMRSGHQARVVVGDENNGCKAYLCQELTAAEGKLTFSSTEFEEYVW